jgi:hypothetical protein
MLIPDRESGSGQLQETFLEVDEALRTLETTLKAAAPLSLGAIVGQSIALTTRLLRACIAADGGKVVPEPSADILDVFRVLVKGEPSWNAIRDNCRELVYYRNCLSMGREDALPTVPAAMAVRTARHVFWYVKTRCIREQRLRD